MENPFHTKVDSSVNEVYSSGLTVTSQNHIVTNENQQTVIGDNTTVEGLDQGSQPVLMLHQEPRVVLPTMITNDIVPTQPDENNEHTGIVDPYSSQIPAMIMSFPEGELENRLLLKGTTVSEPTTREKFSNTLVGCIAHLIHESKCPMALDDIVTRVSPVFTELRKMDGTKYKGNIIKAVNGALSSTGIFTRMDNGKWIVREDELRSYEQRTHKKIESKGKKKRFQTAPEEDKQPKRKYSKRKDRKQSIVQILNSISTSLESENMERNSIYFQNPFVNCSCIENSASLQRILGPDRFRLCLQLYVYFEDLFKVATGDIKYDLQRIVNTGNSFNDKRLIQLWVDIDDMKRRVKNIDKKLSKMMQL